MSVRLVIDMNLSPLWVDVLRQGGIDAIHWWTVDDPRAADREIMDWAVSNDRVVFTHDLDFGAALALTHATGPSVIQLRGPDVLPSKAGATIIAAIQQHEKDLEDGALMVIDEHKLPVRILSL